jgi:hypothetical protein
VKTLARIVVVLAATLLPLTACGSSGGDDDAKGGSTTASTPKPLPFNASGLLGGNAQPNFPKGTPGKVSVVQVGPLDTSQGILLFAFRNNTPEGISHVDWSATARSGGAIVSTGSSQGTTPAQVQPGEVGLSYIFFENSKAIPDDTEYEFKAESSPIDTESFNTAPLKVTEANLAGGAVVGSATNETGASTQGPYSVPVYCFDGDNLLRYRGGFAEQDGPIEAGGKATFTVDLFGEKCPTFAVGVDGYFS